MKASTKFVCDDCGHYWQGGRKCKICGGGPAIPQTTMRKNERRLILVEKENDAHLEYIAGLRPLQRDRMNVQID